MIQSRSYNGIIAGRRGEPYHFGRSLTQRLEPMQATRESDANLRRPEFTTIDDVLELARKLVEGLNELGERKYPLDIRRGVRNMVEQERKSEMLKASSKTYFFDIKETKERKPYLIITESRLKGEGQKPERSSVMIFQENVQEFAAIVTKMAEGIAQSSQ